MVVIKQMVEVLGFPSLSWLQSDELQAQKKLRTEILQLEETLAQVRAEYEMSRIELEQTLAANDQTGSINRCVESIYSQVTAL